MKVWIPSKPHSNLQETLDLICYDILPPERQEPAREVVERSGATLAGRLKAIWQHVT